MTHRRPETTERPKEAKRLARRAAKGSRSQRQAAQEAFLKFYAQGATIQESLDAVGRSWGAYEGWKRGDLDFNRRFLTIKTAKRSLGPPPVPSFKEWRAKYMDLDVENPITLRRQNIGVTYPYMEGFVQALGDPAIRKMICLWPIRHAKSAIVEQLVVYQLCRNPNSRIIIICASVRHAQERSYAIQRMLLDRELYPALHDTWGPWITKGEGRDKTWGQQSFYVAGRKDAQRSPSVSCYGIQTKIYGARADLIILDDIDDPTNGPDERKSVMRSLNGPIRSRIGEGGKLIYIGTRCGVNDCAEQILDRPDWWRDVQSAIKPDGAALEPQMYTLEDLQDLAGDMSEAEFSYMLLNDPAPEGSMMFPPDLVDLAKHNVEVGKIPDGWTTALCLDPARTETAGFIVLAKDPQGNMRIVDAERKRNPRHDGLFEGLQFFVQKYKPRYVIIEEQGGSHFFTDVPYVERFILESGASLHRFKTVSNKNDPSFGMALVATRMAQNRLVIPWGDKTSQERMRPLVEDMLSYRPGPRKSHHGDHWDLLMALWFGVNLFSSGEGRVRSPVIQDPLVARRPYLRSKTPQSVLVPRPGAVGW